MTSRVMLGTVSRILDSIMVLGYLSFSLGKRNVCVITLCLIQNVFTSFSYVSGDRSRRRRRADVWYSISIHVCISCFSLKKRNVCVTSPGIIQIVFYFLFIRERRSKPGKETCGRVGLRRRKTIF